MMGKYSACIDAREKRDNTRGKKERETERKERVFAATDSALCAVLQNYSGDGLIADNISSGDEGR